MTDAPPHSSSGTNEPKSVGSDDCTEHMLLQARQKDQSRWTNIYAAQLEHFATYCFVRAIPSPTPQIAGGVSELANEIDTALTRVLHAQEGGQERGNAEEALRRTLWDNKAGIVASLRGAAQSSQDAADAARYRHLKENCSYYYHEGHNPPSPREFGIEWHWQDGTPERADIDTLIDREIEEKRVLWALDVDEAVALSSTPYESPKEELAIRAAQIDERWRQAMRDLREMFIAGDDIKVMERRIFDLIMMGPELPSTDGKSP